MVNRNKKKKKIPSQTLCFLFFIVFGALKYHVAANFLKVAVKASKMAVVFDECGRECLSGPGNTAGIWSLTGKKTAVVI
jgi:hypothetical protein